MQVFNKEIEDQRTRCLFKSLMNYAGEVLNSLHMKSPKPTVSSAINIHNIERESERFPRCMKIIYSKLMKGDKLGHNQRFNFSLFLKDAGMSMDEANRFWRKYYSNIQGSRKSASLWEERKYKYAYSLRHLYGQEGSRRTYKTASCEALFSQNICPFSGDIEDLSTLHVLRGKSSELEVGATGQECRPCTSVSQDNYSSQPGGGHFLTCCARFENIQDKSFSSPVQLFKLKKALEKN